MNKLTLDTPNQVFFYEQEFYVLSNFSSFAIKHNDRTFPTAEHLYHYTKFNYKVEPQETYNSLEQIRAKIITAKSAHEAFELGQTNGELRNPNWDNIKFSTMLNILRLKVEQHEYVKKKLLETGDRELIENSWRDAVWGWGPDRDGHNALGKLWMVVRQEYKILHELNNPPLPDSEKIFTNQSSISE